MTFLIDGYNLMHAIGYLRAGPPAGGLERARKRFLDWLAEEVRDREVIVRVVFDAHDSPRATPEGDHRGVRVVFAFHETADDRIEEILAAHTLPVRMTVVSNDTRLQAAGRHRGAEVFTCEQFVDWLLDDTRSRRPSKPPIEEKPDPKTSAGDMEEWLNVFSTPKRKRR